MARFCTSCGTPAANDQVKFCAKCGSAIPMPASTATPITPQAVSPSVALPVPPAPVQPSGPLAAPKSSGPWVKIIVGVLAFFVLVCVLALGTCAYIGYRVKKRVEQAKTEYGLDKLPGMPSNPNGSPPVQARDVCSLLTKEEVTEITGVTITDAQGTTEKCTYSSATNPTVFTDSVTWQGGTFAFKMAQGTMKLSTAGTPVVTSVPGIGDEAVTMAPYQGKDKENFQNDLQKDQSGLLKGMAGMLGQVPLMFRKGDIMATVSVTEAHGDIDEAKKALALKMVSRF